MSQPYCFVCRGSQSAATHQSRRPSWPYEAPGRYTRREGPAEPAQPFQNCHSGLPSGPFPNPAKAVGRVSAKVQVELKNFVISKLFLYQKGTKIWRKEKKKGMRGSFRILNSPQNTEWSFSPAFNNHSPAHSPVWTLPCLNTCTLPFKKPYQKNLLQNTVQKPALKEVQQNGSNFSQILFHFWL